MSKRIATVARIDRQVTASYVATFDTDENPISEGGRWLNGRADGVDWTDVIVQDGIAFGAVSRMSAPERRAEQGNLAEEEGVLPEGDYDDPTAVLAGTWGADQHAAGIVFCRKPTQDYFQEVQLRLRHTMRPNSCTGYEVFWRCLKTDEAYAEIVRWNGRIGDWTSVSRRVGLDFGVAHGDLVEATIIGAQITGYVNGVEVISATDGTFAQGSPGIGFNFGVGNTNVDHGFSAYQADTFD